MRGVIVLGAALCACATSVNAQDAVSAKRQPGDVEIKDVWETRAFDVKEARVVLQCQVEPESRFGACEVLSEFPAGKGFGDLTKKYARRLRLQVTGEVGALVQVPFHLVRPAGMGPKLVDLRFNNFPAKEVPSWSQVTAAFPATAKADVGDVRLRCSVSFAGVLSKCMVLSEVPLRQGFASAAQSLIPLFLAEVPPEAETSFSAMIADFNIHFVRPETREQRVLVTPQWTHVLGQGDADRLYPAAATSAGVSKGEVRLRCAVTAQGRLKDCAVVSETPSGIGFGDAAIHAAAVMKMNPWAYAGFPVEGTSVTFPMRFNGP